MSYQNIRLGKPYEGTVRTGMQLSGDGLPMEHQEDGGEISLDLFVPRVKKSDIVYTTAQLGIMLETGINLSVALDGLADQEANPTLKSVLVDLRSHVEAGEDFSESLSRHSRYFDKTYVSLVRASEQTGTTGTMLNSIADYLRKDMESGGKIRAALAYPAVMMVIAAAVTVFLLTYILPKFEPLFAERGDSLPVTTIYMMKASHSMIHFWYLWLLGLFASVAGFLLFRRTEMGRMMLDRAKINLPIMGPMMRKVVISRSIRTLGAMLKSGVPILDALQLSADVSGNYHYEQIWHNVLDQVTSGSQICEALSGNPLFPSTLVQMIGSGEETGKLDVVLQKVSEYYDQEVDTALKGMTSVLEPVMITIMGVVIGTIALSLMLPIFQLSRPAGL